MLVTRPAEAAGFGAVTAALMLINPVSFAAVVVFFFVNLIVGTVAHVPAGGRRVGWAGSWFGGSILHNDHHHHLETAHGFFTQFPDRLLRTRGHEMTQRRYP